MKRTAWFAAGMVIAMCGMAHGSGVALTVTDRDIARLAAMGDAVASEVSRAADLVAQEAGLVAQHLDETLESQAPAVLAQLGDLFDVVNTIDIVGGAGGTYNLSGDATLVVRSRKGELPELGDTLTDLAILARIVEKAADPGGHWGVHDSSQRLYLEGHGVVLLLGVPFPVAPRDDPDTGENRETDQLWRETISEIWGARREAEPRRVYDAEQVIGLKKALTGALQYARNVRGLPRDGELTVIVTGEAYDNSGHRVLGWAPSYVNDRGSWPVNPNVEHYRDAEEVAAEPSRLIVSVPLSAVHALRTETVGEAGLVEKITTRTVPGAGDDMARDMEVLSRVTGKAFHNRLGDAADTPQRSTFVYQSGSSPRARYIDNYGVIVDTQVDFPLLRPDTDASPADDALAPSSLWEDTQREMRGTGQDAHPYSGAWSSHQAGTAAYDGDKVASAQEAMLDLLLETTNVRSLGDDESVVIVVRGPAAEGGGRIVHNIVTDDRLARALIATTAYGRGGSQGTLLTAYAAKADIDRYAAEDFTRDMFRSRVTFAATLAAGRTTRRGGYTVRVRNGENSAPPDQVDASPQSRGSSTSESAPR
ncbi:hypothetical protein CMK11_03850 [Candidatus Poribacteria bacterium]|nr:hypothetical protein [Candidatus Poribacteria bacterium]